MDSMFVVTHMRILAFNLQAAGRLLRSCKDYTLIIGSPEWLLVKLSIALRLRK
jgi:hypothetical protein